MLNIERCNKLADRLMSVWGDVRFACLRAKEMKKANEITSREFDYVERLLNHAF